MNWIPNLTGIALNQFLEDLRKFPVRRVAKGGGGRRVWAPHPTRGPDVEIKSSMKIYNF